MKRIYKALNKGFTLIELLVVITILGILVTLALVTINPAEAQKKARDTQRLKDMATVQSIVEQYLTDNQGTVALVAKDSSGVGTSACGPAGWLSVALGATAGLCKYANVIPVDPSNRVTAATDNTGVLLATAPGVYYYFRFNSNGYKICTYLESTANGAKLKNDGETAVNNVFAIFSADSVACPI